MSYNPHNNYYGTDGTNMDPWGNGEGQQMWFQQVDSQRNNEQQMYLLNRQ